MHKHPRHNEILFRVQLNADTCGMPKREVIERLRAMRRSGSAVVDLWIGVLDAV